MAAGQGEEEKGEESRVHDGEWSSGAERTAHRPGANQSESVRKRRALPITETELSVMAAAASIGSSRKPKAG